MQKRSVRVVWLLLAVVAALSANIVSVPGSARAEDDDEGTVDDLDYVVDINEFAAGLHAHFGDRFGHLRIDRSVEPSRLVVAAIGPSDRDRAVVYTLAGPAADRVDIIRGSLSATRVARTKSRIANALQARAVVPAAVLFDQSTETFEVRSRGLDQATRDEVVALAGGARLIFADDPTFDPRFTHLDRAQYPPYEAGLLLTLSGAGANVGQCTSAFTIFSALTGQFYGTTAGHCGDTGTPVAIGGSGISNIGTNSLTNREPSNSDAARFFIPQVAATDDVYTGGFNGHRDVSGQQNNAALVANLRLCFQGITSGNNNCGNITHVDFPALMEVDGVVHRVEHLWCINADTQSGDSGGPVYHVLPDNSVLAAGIVSGALTDNDPDPFNVRGPMCFTSIEHSLNELNGTLVVD